MLMHLLAPGWLNILSFDHTYPSFIGKMPTLVNFLHELDCEDFTCLDQVVDNFEYGLDSILMDSVETPELDTYFGEPDAISYSVTYAV